MRTPAAETTLHELNNPLYESGSVDDPRASAIYSEPNPAYHTHANEQMARSGDLEPYAYARLQDIKKPTENPNAMHPSV